MDNIINPPLAWSMRKCRKRKHFKYHESEETVGQPLKLILTLFRGRIWNPKIAFISNQGSSKINLIRLIGPAAPSFPYLENKTTGKKPQDPTLVFSFPFLSFLSNRAEPEKEKIIRSKHTRSWMWITRQRIFEGRLNSGIRWLSSWFVDASNYKQRKRPNCHQQKKKAWKKFSRESEGKLHSLAPRVLAENRTPSLPAEERQRVGPHTPSRVLHTDHLPLLRNLPSSHYLKSNYQQHSTTLFKESIPNPISTFRIRH